MNKRKIKINSIFTKDQVVLCKCILRAGCARFDGGAFAPHPQSGMSAQFRASPVLWSSLYYENR